MEREHTFSILVAMEATRKALGALGVAGSVAPWRQDKIVADPIREYGDARWNEFSEQPTKRERDVHIVLQTHSWDVAEVDVRIECGTYWDWHPASLEMKIYRAGWLSMPDEAEYKPHLVETRTFTFNSEGEIVA